MTQPGSPSVIMHMGVPLLNHALSCTADGLVCNDCWGSGEGGRVADGEASALSR